MVKPAPRLTLSTSQKLTMTPALRQALDLLQMTSAELNEAVEAQALANPLLERVESDPAQEEAPPKLPDQPFDDPVGITTNDEREASLLNWGQTARVLDREDDDPLGVEALPQKESLTHALLLQLSGTPTTDTLKTLVKWLIGNLNDEGFLEDPLDALARTCPTVAPRADWLEALRLLQGFEPTGVGAQNRTEALVLQLRSIGAENLDKKPLTELTEKALTLVPELVAKRDIKRLARELKAQESDIFAIYPLLARLDPHPASGYDTGLAPEHVLPDVIVQHTPNGWKATLNPLTVPQMRFNDAYFDLLLSAKLSDEERHQWKVHGQKAKGFVHALEQRASTLVAVSQCIVNEQVDFLMRGPSALKPMIIRDIAERLELSESTISRVTTGKFLQTPRGTFELKYFFSHGLATQEGESISATSVRQRIAQLIAAENPSKPLSDAAIVTLLAAEGIELARRTVAKYRELEGIAPKSLRKRV